MLSKLLTSSRQALAALALVLVLGNVVLGAALTWLAVRPHPTLVSPMVRTEQLVVPGEVPPEAVQRFVLHYLSYFDDYTAHTCKDRSNYALGFVSYEFAETVAKKLTERLRYVEKAREAVQLLLPAPQEVEITSAPRGRFRATIAATRRVYLGDRLAEEGEVRYVVEVQPALPRQGNAFGFMVTGQQVTVVPKEKPSAVQEKGTVNK